MPPVTLSLATIAPTPAGVPVMITSPGLSSMERDRIEIISGTGQINSVRSILLHRTVDGEPDAARARVPSAVHTMQRRNA